jgi:hypothetical protein
MSYITDHSKKFAELNYHIENQDQLKKQANGGNSILFIYPPEEEYFYIQKAKDLFKDRAGFINISELFVKFIEQDGWESFAEYYKSMNIASHKVFYDENSDDYDLFDMIIDEIKKVSNEDKIPFLIRTGCLHGTGIGNINIMENSSVISLSHPLVIFYPSKIENDTLYYMNFKQASKYRCIIVK